MSRVRQYQSNFTIGEIDPLLRGRVDIEQYYSSVEKAKNVIFEPQGGFSRRPGLRYIADYTSSISSENNVRLIPFEYSTGQTYLLLLLIVMFILLIWSVERVIQPGLFQFLILVLSHG
jgi:hypothetical protein